MTLPLLGPTVRVSVFLSIIGALQLFDLVWVTTKGGPIGASSTMATYLYDPFRKGLFGSASAVSIVIFGRWNVRGIVATNARIHDAVLACLAG